MQPAMARNYVRENVPLSRFGVLVAQLESIVASAAQQPPDPLLCFDLLSDLISAIDEEPKESILLWQRKCEDALYSLLTLGAKRPIRHLASIAMARIISKGDGISIYSRASSLQGFLSDGKRSEPQRVAGAAQCLGELYRHFGRKITSGLLETTSIVAKLMKFNEDFVRKEALLMLQNALEGSGGCAAFNAYVEAFRVITRYAVGDKSFVVRIAGARCLRAFANIGGPGLGVAELDTSASLSVKALEDPISSVRDAFAEALGLLLALGLNPEAQVQPRGKGPAPVAKQIEGGLQRHLILPFTRASAPRSKDIRISITLSWVFFLQAIHLKYLHPDSELQSYSIMVMDMLHSENSNDAHAMACVLYILRVGITNQMTEPTQRSFLVFLGRKIQSSDVSPAMKAVALRTLSYTLKSVGEVPLEFKEVLDDTVVAAVSHSSELVRTEAALTLRSLAEVDPICVGGLTSFGVTTINALRESISFEKGSNLKVDLDSLHGQATVLAALVFISPKLPLGYPSRLTQLVLDVSKKMLLQSTRNPAADTTEKEAGWLLLSSLLASMPREELEDQVFDILSLWAPTFAGNAENEINQAANLASLTSVWAAAINALTAFVRCFASPDAVNNGILLQPVLVYLSRALLLIPLVAAKENAVTSTAMAIFTVRILMAYQSLPDPMAYKSDHPQLIQLCTTPFRDPVGCEESSSLRLLLDKRDAWLGPWTPGRDWFEDELRAFQGGKDGLMPCVWENELSSFPQPETINKTLVNQKLLCFGIMLAFQDNAGMISLLGTIDQCLRSGKKQQWHSSSVTNMCVGLLAGLKALLALRPQPLGIEVLSQLQLIFQSILAEGDISASQRRAAAEGLGLLARLGDDLFTARLTRFLLGELIGATDPNYAGSVAFALGCIHRSAGGMALSTLVPSTVSSISQLARSPVAALQVWSLHGLLSTIEAAGLSYVSHVQATLGLAMDILLSEENGLVDLQQGVGRLVNAIVAVLGPELAPGSIFFSRCKSVITEISSCPETATVLESVRFTQQLVLFAPQAVPVHSHVQNLLPTLSSRQPMLRHLAVSTLRHLVEKDPGSIINEQIEDNLFHMLDEETDTEIANLIRSTITRLLYATCPSSPSQWILICRNMVLSSSSRRNTETNRNSERGNGHDGEAGPDDGEDDEDMVSHAKGMPMQGYMGSNVYHYRDKHLRYRTRVFAAECLRHLPIAVGKNLAHFDLSVARSQSTNSDWLVLHVQELISLAYQISTIQFESMQPIGVEILSSIIDKFHSAPDPELPGHLLLEQYQAQLVSAVRTALDTSSGPILLEAGLQLATKILTSGIITTDQVAIKRIFQLISRPLDDFDGLYYPSFAEWVSCKIKIRLLAAHASLKCYTYALLRRHHAEIRQEYAALLPLFAKNSRILGNYWIRILRDYSYICLYLHLRKNWSPFLDGLQSPLVSTKLEPCFKEAWPVILQALALDAVPKNDDVNEDAIKTVQITQEDSVISGFDMVELRSEEYRFLLGFSLLILFGGQQLPDHQKVTLLGFAKSSSIGDSVIEETGNANMKLHEVVLPVFQLLATERFFSAGFLTVEICQQLLQVFAYSIHAGNSWSSLAISVLSQIVKNCPEDFLEEQNFSYLAIELCLAYLFNAFKSADAVPTDCVNWDDLIAPILMAAKTLVKRLKPEKQLKSVVLALLLIGYKCTRASLTESCFLKVNDFIKCTNSLWKTLAYDKSKLDGDEAASCLLAFFGAILNEITHLTKDCISGIHLLENKKSDARKLIQTKLAFSFEQTIVIAKLARESLREGNDENSLYTVLKPCTQSAHEVLSNSSIQVQAIGLQVVKGMLQRETNVKEDGFLLFFTTELIKDIFSIVLKILQKPVTKESAAIVGECLRILVLLQAISKNSVCQRGFMTLFLEAVIVVFSVHEEGYSEGINDIRSIAIKLVSHLAQIPSSSVHFKDALLSMPIAQRQQLQDIIRASVAQDHNPIQFKPAAPHLEIKLPIPKVESVGKDLSSRSTQDHSQEEDLEKEEEQEEEEEDDWDFQSFPASTNMAAVSSTARKVTEEDDQVEKTPRSGNNFEDDEFTDFATSQPQGHPQKELDSDILSDKSEIRAFQESRNDEHVDESFSLHHQKVESVESPVERKFDSDASADKREMGEFGGLTGDRHVNESCSPYHHKVEEVELPVEEVEEHLEKLTGLRPLEHAGGPVDEKLVDDHEQRESSTEGPDVIKTYSHISTESSEDEHLKGASEKNLAEVSEQRQDTASHVDGIEVSHPPPPQSFDDEPCKKSDDETHTDPLVEVGEDTGMQSMAEKKSDKLEQDNGDSSLAVKSRSVSPSSESSAEKGDMLQQGDGDGLLAVKNRSVSPSSESSSETDRS
ncbi:protein SWEETIE isoform X2 [Punica granatum]|uniref:Protein SWEETIE isoform X2 n=1 Tax=Punica granatum TaxID=22663 RepID=A0A6P8DTW3_PUNGR|nr:protein SWEETIE isoform X2 [Punica granatum]